LAGNALGVPGTAQALKSYRAAKRGETTFDTLLGNYTEVDKRSSAGRSSRGSRGGRSTR